MPRRKGACCGEGSSVVTQILMGEGYLVKNCPSPFVIRLTTVIAPAARRAATRPLRHSLFTCQTAVSIPAARWRPGCEPIPAPMRGGRSADRRPGAAAPGWPAHDAAGRALARRPASNNVGRAPFGAPPWRFLAVGRASVCGIILRNPCSELLAARSYCLAGGAPDLPGLRLRAASRDATPRSAYGPPPEDAPR
jgi:hypothetical protein